MTDFAFPKPNRFTSQLFDKLSRHPKRVVFTEGEDIRVIRVAAECVRREVIAPILLGRISEMKRIADEHGVSLSMVRLIEPAESSDFGLFCDRFRRMERYRKIYASEKDASGFMSRPAYFGAMMVQYGQADALVAGNQVAPISVFRPLLQMIKPLATVPAVYSTIVMVDDRESLPKDRILFLSDCGINPEPTAEHLAAMSVETARLCRHLEGRSPRVAMLSYSNKGSAVSTSTRKMEAATALARELARRELVDLSIEGEIQADVALVPAVAANKVPNSVLGGAADVLIFPSLDASHIAYKLLTHFAGLKPYGQIIQGLTRPAAQVSRSASEEQILGTAAAVAVEAIEYRKLYGGDDEV
ncbi:phosphate acyltransferase [Sulfuriroseicoccus oceanibius]|uniref:Phosphate acetyl/butaryl transferase domain-containing protein n=1 Tax=Sulfuriroseicoccus oceanibius TaxID=2707525 RepID=A0A6B3LBV5_9BACT|nr:phosphate acyltransferase [Sulfuriroseicoccus oceanibius]QQL45270.1 hypothetical protein G3M56_001395 [Sulfuriroseicoccus oceanibius]